MGAEAAANKMTTHKESDAEVAELKGRYDKVKGISDEWCKKVDTLVKEWKLLDNTVNELNSWVAQDRGAEGEQQYSLEKMESTLGDSKISSRRRKSWLKTCKCLACQRKFNFHHHRSSLGTAFLKKCSESSIMKIQRI